MHVSLRIKGHLDPEWLVDWEVAGSPLEGGRV
jgi:hypothetical protein